MHQTTRRIFQLLTLLLLACLLAACGDGGDDGNSMEPLEAPEFDLTGKWIGTEIDCDSDSLSQSYLDPLYTTKSDN